MPSTFTRRAAVVWILAAPIARVSTQGVSATQQGHTATTNVPVTKVMLFSSGVGYFEHSGIVHGNSTTELRFKTSQINDILKSIVLQDQDGGHVGTVTYPSQDPLGKTLKSFQVDITQNPSLADLLNQLRGARVTIQAKAERLTGTIVGVESRRMATEKGEAASVPVLNLLTGAMIRSIELQSIASLTLDDPELQDELTKAFVGARAGAGSGQEAGDDLIHRHGRPARANRLCGRDARLEDELSPRARSRE